MAKSLGQTAEFFRRMGEWRNQLRHAAPSANQSHFTASASHNHSEQSTFRRAIVQHLTTTETSCMLGRILQSVSAMLTPFRSIRSGIIMCVLVVLNTPAGSFFDATSLTGSVLLIVLFSDVVKLYEVRQVPQIQENVPKIFQFKSDRRGGHRHY